MPFTDQHSLGPKTTERVRVAEIESFASSNDNNYCYRAQFGQSRVCLGDTRRWFSLGVCHRPAVPIRQDTDRRVRRQSKWIVSRRSARIHKQCQRRLSASD